MRAISAICLILFVASCGSRKVASPKQHGKDKENIILQSMAKEYGLEIAQMQTKKLYLLIHDWYGVPHKDNGCTKSGTDCSCFVQMIYQQTYNQYVGRHTGEMYKNTKRIHKNQLREGDLVFFITKGKSISHVGVYLHNNKFVHVSSRKGVMISSLDEDYFIKTYDTAGKRP
jgi:lipoprotein Spr